jgi:hypothetical protein
MKICVISSSAMPGPPDGYTVFIQVEGNERSLEWSFNDDGVLDLYTE